MVATTSPRRTVSVLLLAVLLYAVNTIAQQTAFYKSVSVWQLS